MAWASLPVATPEHRQEAGTIQRLVWVHHHQWGFGNVASRRFHIDMEKQEQADVTMKEVYESLPQTDIERRIGYAQTAVVSDYSGQPRYNRF